MSKKVLFCLVAISAGVIGVILFLSQEKEPPHRSGMTKKERDEMVARDFSSRKEIKATPVTFEKRGQNSK